MKSHDRNTVDCEAINEDLLEFALGTISGRDRTRVLDHLESCVRCSAELESLAAVNDAMLALAPQAEPPLGFESRLVERIHEENVSASPLRRHGILWLASAAVLLAVVAFGLGTTMNHVSGSTRYASSRPSMAQLTSHGIVTGQVFVSPGHPSWIYMTLDDGNWSGTAWCRVTLKNGNVKTVGRFVLTNGYGAWTAPLRVALSEVRSAQLVDEKGIVLASATLHV